MRLWERLHRRFLVKEITDRNGILHFQRWQLMSTPWFSVYAHRIAKADRDQHPHNHPWDFLALILRGGYTEEVKQVGKPVVRVTRKISRIFGHSRSAFHRIVEMPSPTWTIVLTGKKKFTPDGKDDWGYLVNDKFVDFERYRQNKRLIDKIVDATRCYSDPT